MFLKILRKFHNNFQNFLENLMNFMKVCKSLEQIKYEYTLCCN